MKLVAAYATPNPEPTKDMTSPATLNEEVEKVAVKAAALEENI